MHLGLFYSQTNLQRADKIYCNFLTTRAVSACFNARRARNTFTITFSVRCNNSVERPECGPMPNVID